ncbi:nitrous oxide reductase accessory protein NosL [Pyrobaculum calidifontis]|uniref:Uncharacterized protein n=1 Tax=Pyrobaculum calidifontis (strain DSM 21063 / JCM 11548 / VA1) TaxID=410359 RepID=A3MXI9_PYRCJ|nr:nitrous oxide reductase accessory protein NosL [Pyrobaculum calidifontis]ABO09356.1 hypothetical protein Pcal_1940 [Pyrobaculum calidifontis JCM 11548]
MAKANYLVPLVVAVVVGLAAYFAGVSTAPTATVTQTVERTVTQTVTQAVVKRNALEEMFTNGTFAHRCILCGMDVSEAEKMGVSAIVTFSTGKTAKTDDIGCIFRMALMPVEKWPFIRRITNVTGLSTAEVRQALGDVVSVMVPDYESAKAGVPLYIDAKRAYYVIMQNLKTPMGDCVFAFADKDTAAKYNTTVYAYDQMLQLYKEVMQKTGMPRPNWCRSGGMMPSHGG